MAKDWKERAPDAPASAPAATTKPAPAGFVLAKNFGFVANGKSHWWAAGHRFDPARDGELISLAHRHGAIFEG